ncbi:glycosyl hydrolase family 2 [Haloactinopolyspora alba]|uniref:Glycosyl hydrolase family 2 n=1 Tax=Haloactinopolyspora alba TaxID=648780 RepID=A0A2P8EBM4_9ACTN|nr:glycoside hydrolase family 2 TIM barrel-domain containing protein [Haloactinopolyspora alba]PSL06850.1 glycosyl hydrolase family 2 [Haloactinopolyspora alba]
MPEHSLHPRPRLVRDEWRDLCGTWRFAFDDDDEGERGRWFESPPGVFDATIEVPYPPESKLSGVHDRTRHPVLWYQREFTAPVPAGGDRLLLHFGAVDYRARVWLNGAHLVDHEGGHTPFTVDVTDALDPSGTQSLVVRTTDEPGDAGQPRGKQTWSAEPSGIFYDRTSGIWQPVWLERVPGTYLRDVVFTPRPSEGAVDVEVWLGGHAQAGEADVEVELAHDGSPLARQRMRTDREYARFTVAVPALSAADGRRLWWSPESPTLLDAVVTLTAGSVADSVRSYVGVREVGVRDGAFTLNGRPYYLRLVLEQGYWPDSHLAAPDADALRREVELVKELGFTGVRVHQKVEDPRFLYWCDRLGLLVWGEMANAHEFSAVSAERLTREWIDVVRRDRGHPCIVTWVPINESWGVPEIATSTRQQDLATALYHLTRALDPSRPVISNDGWEHTESDILGVHDYATTGAALNERYGSPDAIERTLAGTGPAARRITLNDADRPGRPLVITEFGGLSYVPASGEKWYGYRAVESAEEFRSAFADLVGALLDAPGVAGFCYTQLTDTLQETNGLVTDDRTPKLPVDVIRAAVSRPSRALAHEELRQEQRRARDAAGDGT